jgi:hypothetical protein
MKVHSSEVSFKKILRCFLKAVRKFAVELRQLPIAETHVSNIMP